MYLKKIAHATATTRIDGAVKITWRNANVLTAVDDVMKIMDTHGVSPFYEASRFHIIIPEWNPTQKNQIDEKQSSFWGGWGRVPGLEQTDVGALPGPSMLRFALQSKLTGLKSFR